MGEPYWYFTQYQPDLLSALNQLREQEFLACRYHPVVPFPFSSETDNSLASRAQHDSIGEALSAAAEFGTRSILDIHYVSKAPWKLGTEEFFNLLCEASDSAMDLLFTSFPLTLRESMEFLGTGYPTRTCIETKILDAKFLDHQGYAFWSTIEKGTARHIIVYKNSVPDEIFFAGYSFA